MRRVRRTFLFVGCLVLCTGSFFAAAESVSSPDGRIQISVDLNKDANLAYSVEFENQPVLVDSLLKRSFKEQSSLGEGMTIEDKKTTTIDETWQRVCGKTKTVHNHANELRITLREKANSKWGKAAKPQT